MIYEETDPKFAKKLNGKEPNKLTIDSKPNKIATPYAAPTTPAITVPTRESGQNVPIISVVSKIQ